MRAFPLLAVALCACPALDDDDSATSDDPFRALVLYGPFAGDASLGTLGPDGGHPDLDRVGLAGSDWSVRVTDGDPWLLGRFGTDALRRYDGLDLSAPVLEFSVGTPGNPNDVARCADGLFVTRYDLIASGGGGDVGVFDPGTGSPRGRVDLSAFAEGTDGTPEPASSVVLGDTLYVALNRMDRDGGWVADPVGKVVAVDCAARQVVDSWDTGPNPQIVGDGERLLVVTDVGVQALHPTAGVEPLLLNETLGQTVLGIAGYGDALLAVSEDGEGLNSLFCVDRDGEWSLLSSTSSRAWALRTAPDGRVWVLWRDHWITSPIDPGGISIVDAAACVEDSDGPIPLPADPIDVAFLAR